MSDVILKKLQIFLWMFQVTSGNTSITRWQLSVDNSLSSLYSNQSLKYTKDNFLDLHSNGIVNEISCNQR